MDSFRQQILAEENMSNLTAASGAEASVSSNRPPPPPPPSGSRKPTPGGPAKKRRNLPGNPDPDAEVIALSPKTLLNANRFVCEICGKGFQRDQNLQLHRRGHNLPWKLKQRSGKEVVRKKVYVCPVAACVHHDPSRALGDLTGIKKHFCRKHGEKKWRCDKCSKRYAVQSDWKAHAKVCGTREYKCDCGTLFSRRDSFITHRAFCDALAEESARAVTAATPQLGGQDRQPLVFPNYVDVVTPNCTDHERQGEQQLQFGARPVLVPPWLSCLEQPQAPPPAAAPPPPPRQQLDLLPPSSLFPTGLEAQGLLRDSQSAALFLYQPSPAHMSATALLQKAAQMGSTVSRQASHGQLQAAPSVLSSFSSASGGRDGTPAPPLEEASLWVPRRSSDGESGDAGCTDDSLWRRRGGDHDRLGRGTRDFLGLRTSLSAGGDLLGMAAGFEPCMSSSSSYDQPPPPPLQPSKKPWI